MKNIRKQIYSYNIYLQMTQKELKHPIAEYQGIEINVNDYKDEYKNQIYNIKCGKPMTYHKESTTENPNSAHFQHRKNTKCKECNETEKFAFFITDEDKEDYERRKEGDNISSISEDELITVNNITKNLWNYLKNPKNLYIVGTCVGAGALIFNFFVNKNIYSFQKIYFKLLTQSTTSSKCRP